MRDSFCSPGWPLKAWHLSSVSIMGTFHVSGAVCAIELWPPTFQWSHRSQRWFCSSCAESRVPAHLLCSWTCLAHMGNISRARVPPPPPCRVTLSCMRLLCLPSSEPKALSLVCHLCWVFLLKAVSLTPQATHRPLQGPLVVEWLRLDWVVCMGLAPTGRDTVQPWVLPGPTCGQVRLWTGALTG